MTARTALLVAVLLLTAACGGGAQEPTPTPTSPTSPPAPSPTPPSPTAAPGSPEPTGAATTTRSVEIFLINDRRGDPCGEVFPVSRTVPAAAPLRPALEALLAGPTPAERDQGYGGWFSAETADLLEGVRLEDRRALVSFSRRLREVIPNASSSCGSAGLLAQLDRTVTQFPTVDEARYSLEGDRAAFYEWLQFAVPTP